MSALSYVRGTKQAEGLGTSQLGGNLVWQVEQSGGPGLRRGRHCAAEEVTIHSVPQASRFGK